MSGITIIIIIMTVTGTLITPVIREPGPNPHRLYLDKDRKVISGVCAGIANYYGWRSPDMLRFAWFLFGVLFLSVSDHRIHCCCGGFEAGSAYANPSVPGRRKILAHIFDQAARDIFLS